MVSDRPLKQHKGDGGKQEDEKGEITLRVGEETTDISKPLIRVAKDEEDKHELCDQTNNSA